MLCIALCVLAGGASALPEDSWRENITVTSGTFVQVVTFGTDENGSDGYDQGLDLPAPPPPPNPVVDVYFAIEDSLFDRLYGDIRYILNAADPERIWTLQVLSKNEDALLAWDPAALPADIIFTLSAAGSEYDMKEVASVSLAKSAGYTPVTIHARYSLATSPVANFTANRTAGLAPLAVQFNDTSIGDPTAWLWSFGDNTTSTEQHPIHTYTTAGVYTVNLTVWNAGGKDSVVQRDAITVVDAASPIWRENITVTSGTFVQVVTFGTDENGSDGYDQGLDLPAPPPPPNPVVDVYFAIEDSLFDRLYGDIRYILNAADPERIWTLQVLSKNEDALLAWDPAALPADIIFTLSAAGSEYDMKEVASVSLAKSAGYTPVTIHARYSLATSPVANFTANRTAGLAPLAVQFNDTSIGDPTAWLWSFGDNTTSTEQHPIHTYTTAGVYTVSLTATNAGGSSTETKTDYITVLEPPVAVFTANVTEGNMPLAVRFIDQSAGNVTAWFWDFGDGATSTEQSPIHVYTAAGAYTVSLNASNAYGYNISTPTTVTVLEPPVAVFTANVTEGNAPLAVRFINQSAGNVTAWLWDFGDGTTSTEQSPTHVYTAAGAYTVSLNASNAYGYNISTPTTITVLEPLVANFTASTTTGPAPLVVQFTDVSAGNPTAWLWSFGDGNTSTDQNPIHTYTAPGNYTVNLTASTASGSATLSRPGYITVTVRGDFNGDGEVDISDVSKVAYMVIGKVAADPAADFNQNGKVDIGDAAKIAYYSVGKIGEL